MMKILSADNFFNGHSPVPLLKKGQPNMKISAFWSGLVRVWSGLPVFETRMVIDLVKVVKVVKVVLSYRTCVHAHARTLSFWASVIYF
jgi:hypothetical protein